MRAIALLFALAACTGGGGTTDDTAALAAEATAWCDDQRDQQAGCFDDATYDACIACYTECGEPCPVAESCPVQYPSCN